MDTTPINTTPINTTPLTRTGTNPLRSTPRPRIVIVGGGFVGFTLARRLQRRLRRDEAEVVLVDPHVAEHQFPAGVRRSAGASGEAESADVILYLVDHDDVDRAGILASGTPILDCRHALTGPTVQHL